MTSVIHELQKYFIYWFLKEQIHNVKISLRNKNYFKKIFYIFKVRNEKIPAYDCNAWPVTHRPTAQGGPRPLRSQVLVLICQRHVCAGMCNTSIIPTC